MLIVHVTPPDLHTQAEPKEMSVAVFDNGGRRSGLDRRCFNYLVHIPERREQVDRRCGTDRRQTPPALIAGERRACFLGHRYAVAPTEGAPASPASRAPR